MSNQRATAMIRIMEELPTHWANGAYMITAAERSAIVDILGDYLALIENNKRAHKPARISAEALADAAIKWTSHASAAAGKGDGADHER